MAAKIEILPAELFEHPAYRNLTVAERCALQEMLAKFGRLRQMSIPGNGRLGMSAREMAERLGIARDTASAALRQLEQRGFIACTEPGSFKRKREASLWRLTMYPCDVTGLRATFDYLDPARLLKVQVTLAPGAESDPEEKAA